MRETWMKIQSHQGDYSITAGDPFDGIENGLGVREFLVIDSRVAALYAAPLKNSLESGRVLRVEALESNKSLESIPDYIMSLVEIGIQRGDTIVSVGGGIVQEISAFIAAILFRGLDWRFYPTTLLAQADSCLGGKSSINVRGTKNQVGTFTPPKTIHISPTILETLEDRDIRSGLGEIIKAHVILGGKDYEWIQKNYDSLWKEKKKLLQAIRRSLELKQRLVEVDEFDHNERALLNYGHTFGHAIESATDYGVPHGIAITIGMDMANFVSVQLGFLDQQIHEEMHSLLIRNYKDFEKVPVSREVFFQAIAKDKKNTGGDVVLLLTKGPGQVFRQQVSNDKRLQMLCHAFLDRVSP